MAAVQIASIAAGCAPLSDAHFPSAPSEIMAEFLPCGQNGLHSELEVGASTTTECAVMVVIVVRPVVLWVITGVMLIR